MYQTPTAELDVNHTLFRGKITKDYSYLTFREALALYIQRREEVLSPSTIASYIGQQECHYQEIMDEVLAELDDDKLQCVVDNLSSSLSPKTVKNLYGTLHAVLEEFIPDHFFRVNLPQWIAPELYIPTTNEVNKLIETAEDDILVPILLAAYGGLRRSEVSGLRNSDFTSNGVHIKRAVVYDKNNEPCIKLPKTKAGYRFVPLPHPVLLQAKRWSEFGILPNNITYLHGKTIKEADLPHFSFHKLRHYFASELHAKGIPDQYIAKIGGWSSVATLQKIYQHTLRDREKEMNNRIVSIFTSNIKHQT